VVINGTLVDLIRVGDTVVRSVIKRGTDVTSLEWTDGSIR
jgi:hypothetical protein